MWVLPREAMDARWRPVLVALLVAGTCAVGVRAFVAEPRRISSGSMEPTLQIGDHLVVDKLTYRRREPRTGEIVLFRMPEGLLADSPDVMVKRVIAAAGQQVQVTGGRVLIDGEALAEGYLAESPSYEWGPTEVPPHSLFVLGDNRNASADSHVWGFLPRDAVVGRVALRLWPEPRLY